MSTTPDPNHPFTNEEIVYLLRALWDALQAPGWTFKNRKDLEKLGEAIFSGKKLKELDDALYDRIFPHLVTVVTHLGTTLRDTQPDAPTSVTAPLETPLQVAPPTVSPPVSQPRVADPRVADPRVANPRVNDPQAAPQRSETPTNTPHLVVATADQEAS